jgi:hypothetical protein
MRNAVLWQRVFQGVVCVLGAMQRAAQHPVHTPQPETHAATTLHHL